MLLLSALLVACGGGSSLSPANTSSSNSGNNGGSSGGANLPAPAVVTVAQGQTVAGVDITVVTHAASPAPNAQNLGVNPVSGQASASNTGGAIHRGGTNRVILFGPGLNGQMTVRISGPNDIGISNIAGIQATDNTPGLAFIASATSSAALGARTVYLVNTSGDVTSFTGSLEVVP